MKILTLLLAIILLSSCKVTKIGTYYLNTIMPLDSTDIYQWKNGRSTIITKGKPEECDFGDSLYILIKKQ
mgnify:CR=1 FL=1